ncbi:MAG: hypothetical protein VZQ55_09395 [Ruminococcus sp.]|nr:hypothetical protein [Ruminococcus sp.]
MSLDSAARKSGTRNHPLCGCASKEVQKIPQSGRIRMFEPY